MERISFAYQTLSPQLQRVADFLEKNQHQVWQLRNMDIAAACNVTPSTIARFANRFGYAGFSDMQAAFVNDFIARNIPVSNPIDETPAGSITDQDVLQRLKGDIDSIQQIIRNDIVGFSKLKSSIVNAHRVYVIGLGWLYSAAIYLENTLVDCGLDASTLNGVSGFFVNDVHRVKSKDILIVIGEKKELQLFDELMRFKSGIKQQTILITADDHVKTPSWASYGVTIPSRRNTQQNKRSMIGYIAFLNALIASLE
ncbi:MurR/RpiR family transcriptional regulator [Leeia oryzae]|uniref:MurR/RpiR family transcriptional regulator n=1 Tax=Leeia oryzae TaxID=356662 RepID=UPI001FDF3E7F|nr:MurR/RpiR family transcriptional regulator [Leeia oryzae]